jgi:hypothetical protein
MNRTRVTHVCDKLAKASTHDARFFDSLPFLCNSLLIENSKTPTMFPSSAHSAAVLRALRVSRCS